MTSHGESTPAPTSALTRRLKRAALAVGAVALLLGGALGIRALGSQAATPVSVALPDAVAPQIQHAQVLGPHNPRAPLTVELVATPNHAAELDALLEALYDPNSATYHQWLQASDFEARFGPTAEQRAQFDHFAATAGLHPAADAPGAFLIRYTGTTAAMEHAFHVQINDYRLADGTTVYANAEAPSIPTNLVTSVQGVVGLDSVPASHPLYVRPSSQTQLPKYGGGVNGTGLTPSQIRSLYNANPVYHITSGRGFTLGLYELSNWKYSDVQKYAAQYHLPLVSGEVQSLYVDGGPGSNNTGATEVELDVDMQLAMAPGVGHIYVYNAANGTIGMLDEFAAIAHQNVASAISDSWGICEPLTTAADRNAEATAFKQMAAQGQSIFAAAGDDGAFDCESLYYQESNPPSYFNGLYVDDPASNPYVTAAGGTSFFKTYDPGTNANPTYPGNSYEYVWNTYGYCRSTPVYFGGVPYYCPFGGGGGGISREWASPSYQYGPGVVSGFTKHGSWCGQASTVMCREVPDVSMNADAETGYSIYCTDTGDQNCRNNYGWQQIGGTSAVAPLWAGIAALADSYHHRRIGFFNPQLYGIMRLSTAYTTYFHDINHGATYRYNGTLITVRSNGYYTLTSGYDEATGIGSPNIYNIVVGM
jgi:subtilase family serine protease